MNRSLLHNAIPRTLLLIALSSCLFAQSPAPEKYPMQPALVEPGPKELASSRVSMVSAAHPFATQAGLEMLRRGGNAMDATIAATMVTAVLDVGLSTFGGGGELTYYDANSKHWQADAGDFEILIGRSAEQIELRGKVTLATGLTIGNGELK